MGTLRAARWLVPARCPVCGGPLAVDALVCGGCMRELNSSPVLRKSPPEAVDRVSSCADHEGIARELLAAFKFRHLAGLAGLIGGFMADALEAPQPGTLLVPVPPAWMRTRMRGFDPVGLLAAEVSARVGVPGPAGPVLKRRGQGRQRGQGRTGRLADPPDIRPVTGSGRLVGGREVLLVDDVMTTGATLSAAAGALRQSGAVAVSALTFTRRL